MPIVWTCGSLADATDAAITLPYRISVDFLGWKPLQSRSAPILGVAVNRPVSFKMARPIPTALGCFLFRVGVCSFPVPIVLNARVLLEIPSLGCFLGRRILLIVGAVVFSESLAVPGSPRPHVLRPFSDSHRREVTVSSGQRYSIGVRIRSPSGVTDTTRVRDPGPVGVRSKVGMPCSVMCVRDAVLVWMAGETK